MGYSGTIIFPGHHTGLRGYRSNEISFDFLLTFVCTDVNFILVSGLCNWRCHHQIIIIIIIIIIITTTTTTTITTTTTTTKVNLSLCFNWAPRHESVLGEWRYSSTHSLTSALDGGEWSASGPGHFTSRERAPGTHWIGGWVGPRAFLDAVVKRKISSLCRESNPRAPIVQPVAQRCTD
jgi:hypothetical protein